jgi:hypothetical protein
MIDLRKRTAKVGDKYGMMDSQTRERAEGVILRVENAHVLMELDGDPNRRFWMPKSFFEFDPRVGWWIPTEVK